MLLLSAIVLCMTTAMSGLLVLIPTTKLRPYLTCLLPFSGSFLFTFTLTHLLPSLYKVATDRHELLYCLVLGVFLQFFLDLLSRGIAHGHLKLEVPSPLIRHTTIMPLLLGLCIHGLLDGFVIGGMPLISACLGHAHATTSHNSLLWAMILHKIPAALSLVSLLLARRCSKWMTSCYLLLFALSSPLGIYITQRGASSTSFEATGSLLMLWSLSVGSLLHIACTILSEANPKHLPDLVTTGAICVGMGMACYMA